MNHSNCFCDLGIFDDNNTCEMIDGWVDRWIGVLMDG